MSTVELCIKSAIVASLMKCKLPAVACNLLEGASEAWRTFTLVIRLFATMITTIEQFVAYAVTDMIAERIFIIDRQGSALALLLCFLIC